MRKVEAHPLSDVIVSAARNKVGIRFRPQGRTADGLDCLGLILAVANDVGLRVSAPIFELRGRRNTQSEYWMLQSGLSKVQHAELGDVLLQSPGHLQVHLGICCGKTLIEAHAGLGKVIERPIADGEQWQSAWRLPVGDV